MIPLADPIRLDSWTTSKVLYTLLVELLHVRRARRLSQWHGLNFQWLPFLFSVHFPHLPLTWHHWGKYEVGEFSMLCLSSQVVIHEATKPSAYKLLCSYTHVYMHMHSQIHSSDFWSTKAGTKWRQPWYLHLWSSGGLLQGTVGHCVWWLLGLHKHSCSLSWTWIFRFQCQLDHQ